MILYRNKFLNIANVWFDETLDREQLDVIYYLQRSSPVPHAKCRDFYTIILDLTDDENTLFNKIKKGTRYEIRRANEKDGIACVKPSASEPLSLEEFCEIYNKFLSQKGLQGVNKKKLSLLSASGNLYLSCAKSHFGEKLVYHAYYRGESRVRLLHSVSLFRDSSDNDKRNLIGRANRCLHWSDMVAFKKDNMAVYDFGGWHDGKKDEEKLRINRFKEEFGGTVVKNYDCDEGVTLKGKMALLVRKYLRS